MDEDAAIRTLLPMLRRLASRFARRNRCRPDDALSDALHGALAALRSWRPGASALATWAWTKARSYMASQHAVRSGGKRKASPWKRALSLDAPPPDRGRPFAFADPRAADPAALAERRDLVARVLDAAGPERAGTLRVVYLEGVPPRDAGPLWGVSRTAAAMRAARAVAAVRAALGVEEG